MASGIFAVHIQTPITSNPIPYFKPTTPLSLFSEFQRRQSSLSLRPCKNFKSLRRRGISHLVPQSSLSSSEPPSTKDEAIFQAKTSLFSSLEKPLNNPKLAGRLTKVRHPRFRVEIPVIDDSPVSLSQLAVEMFSKIPIKRKGQETKILILWPNHISAEAASKAFDPQSSVKNIAISGALQGDIQTVNSTDITVFFSPNSSELAVMKKITDLINPKPVVIFNPNWAFEDEANFEMSGFVASFEVVFSFVGLEVRGILNKRKGIIFKSVKDGVLAGTKWNVLVEEEGKLRVISSFKSRPSIMEVENVLYNLMAINSPVTKSAKFLKNLVSNVTGKK